MFKAECDICHSECDKVAHFVESKVVTNYATNNKDLGDPRGTLAAEMQLCLCQTCYGKLGFPNIYNTGRIH